MSDSPRPWNLVVRPGPAAYPLRSDLSPAGVPRLGIRVVTAAVLCHLLSQHTPHSTLFSTPFATPVPTNPAAARAQDAMVSDEHYEICLPILEDSNLDDEDRTDKLEELLKTETTLTGTTLDNAILDVLWRYREGGTSSASPPPIRQTILRRPSPASWRTSTTPLSGSPRLGVSPLAPPGYVPTPLNRTKSSTASPFSSPRPSPRLNFATPVIPHSPNLNAYEFANDTTPAQEIVGDYPTENVDWLVNDDGGASLTASYPIPSGLNAAAPEFSSSVSAQQSDMTPYDMLRTILGQSRTDDEIEAALASHGYDLSATVASIMDNQARGVNPLTGSPEEPKKVLVGRSTTPQPRPATPVNQNQKSGIICKFYLSSGQCLRSDCRYSHDLSSHLCKYVSKKIYRARISICVLTRIASIGTG